MHEANSGFYVPHVSLFGRILSSFTLTPLSFIMSLKVISVRFKASLICNSVIERLVTSLARFIIW